MYLLADSDAAAECTVSAERVLPASLADTTLAE